MGVLKSGGSPYHSYTGHGNSSAYVPSGCPTFSRLCNRLTCCITGRPVTQPGMAIAVHMQRVVCEAMVRYDIVQYGKVQSSMVRICDLLFIYIHLT